LKCSGKIRGLRAYFTLKTGSQTPPTAEVGLVCRHRMRK
jgi:hypothetical protein